MRDHAQIRYSNYYLSSQYIDSIHMSSFGFGDMFNWQKYANTFFL
jgi:hypothetical protein